MKNLKVADSNSAGVATTTIREKRNLLEVQIMRKTSFFLILLIISSSGSVIADSDSEVIISNSELMVAFRSYGNAEVYRDDSCVTVKTKSKKASGVVVDIRRHVYKNYEGLVFSVLSQSPILPTVVKNHNANKPIRQTSPKSGTLSVIIADKPQSALIYAHYPFVYKICLSHYLKTNSQRSPERKLFSDMTLQNQSQAKSANISKSSLSLQFDLDGKSTINVAKVFMNHVYTNTKTGFATHLNYELSFYNLGKKDVFGVCNNMSELLMVALSKFDIDARHVYFGFNKEKTHQAIEIKEHKDSDWVLFDPTFNAVFEDPVSKNLMSLEDLATYLSNHDDVPVSYISEGGKDPHGRNIETYYVPYADLIRHRFYNKIAFERFLTSTVQE